MDGKITETLYRTYSHYLKHKYGEKVYKIPINLPVTCPNRDGRISTEGCYFCSELGTGFEADWQGSSVKKQLMDQMTHIESKYGIKKYIAYFQNYTNTYLDIELFKDYIKSAIIEPVVEMSIATRPDCINTEQLEFLAQVKKENHIDIELEIGLQSTNEDTLVKINRGHTVGDFINAVSLIKSYDINVCTHLIPNLPWDTMTDVKNSVELMNQLEIKQVKLHSLYIAKNTRFETLYTAGKLPIGDSDEYQKRVIYFIEHVKEDVVFQRLFARAPKENVIFCNWGHSWRKLHNELLKKMIDEGRYQGRLYKEKA